MTWTLVIFDDWQALYNSDGERVLESDRLEAGEIVEAMGGKARFASQIFDLEVAHEGTPEYLDEFPDYAFTQ